MHNMRSVIFFLFCLFLIIFFSFFLHAHQLELNWSELNTHHPASLHPDSHLLPTSKNTQYTISYIGENLTSWFSLMSGIRSEHINFNDYNLLDQNQKPITFNNNTHYRFMSQFYFVFDDHSFVIDLSSHLTDSPYRQNTISTEYSFALFNKTTILGFQIGYSQQNQPKSYYLYEFETVARPTQINSSTYSQFIEQVFSSSWKTRFEISLSRRIEDRPQNYGFLLKNIWALSDRSFIGLDIDHTYEDTNQTLTQAELGYFKQTGGTLSFTYEPIYDLLMSLSYGINTEYESAIDNKQIIRKIASDQYGLGLEYDQGSFIVHFKGQYIKTNTKTYAHFISGGLEWPL